MIGNPHRYALELHWTGNRGKGTSGYRAYDRSYDLSAGGKPALAGSADATFRGDRAKWNPEEMLLGALSSCHMLSYLHVCADAGINVVAYRDAPDGSMELRTDGSGRFTEVTLRPHVVVAEGSDPETAQILHHLAHEKCFIANSVNFAVHCQATINVRTAHATELPTLHLQEAV
ncbi:OsmC family protein [Terriglobus sp.]|uniref:OsmC family protein n=1 Tax=Terriglobus sp. TaxID=1889013 RepID=UPI003B0013E0